LGKAIFGQSQSFSGSSRQPKMKHINILKGKNGIHSGKMPKIRFLKLIIEWDESSKVISNGTILSTM